MLIYVGTILPCKITNNNRTSKEGVENTQQILDSDYKCTENQQVLLILMLQVVDCDQ